MRKRWWISGILTVVLTAGFGAGNAGNGNQQLNRVEQDAITHVCAAELPDEETEIVPFRGRESYILSEWELETEGELEQAAMVKQYISTMTLREKVCQMIIADPENLVTTHDVTKVDVEMKQALADYPVGGIMLKSRNIESKKQLKKLIKNLQKQSEIALFLAVDEEGGNVSRVLSNLGNREGGTIDPMYEYKDDGTDTAFENARELGSNLAYYGFNLDFAPVADVWSNPKNTVIGKRAYSDDYEQAAELIPYAVEGFHAGGVMCTLKHFPGHGDTVEDSHYGTAYVRATLKELETQEFVPFRAGIRAGADCVMIGHLVVPDISDQPADLSETLVTDCLRNELAFHGLIITDSFQMEAITDHYEPGEAAVRAIQAGVDLILEPEDLGETVEGILTASDKGELTEKRIDESVERILMAKQVNGIQMDHKIEKQ